MYLALAVLFLMATHIGLSYLIAVTIGRDRDMGVMDTFIFCLLLSPVVGLTFHVIDVLLKPKGCKWCGSLEPGGQFCTNCGKDARGNLLENFVPGKQTTYQKSKLK